MTANNQQSEPQRCERYWELYDRMIRAVEKLQLERCRDVGTKAIAEAAEKKADALLVMGYHFELCEICQEWWRSFQFFPTQGEEARSV